VLRYTDDTQLTIALTLTLLDDPSVDQAGFVRRILEVYEDGRGYGRGMRTLVARWREGVDPSAAVTSVFPEGSYGNGAAMRTAPVALRWPDDPETRADVARRQAMVTHAHPVGIDGALVMSEAVALAATRGVFGAAEVVEAAEAARTAQVREPCELAAAWVERWTDPEVTLSAVADALGNGVTADTSVPAALWAAATGQQTVEVMSLALGLGGDADTIAAMAGAIHGAAVGRDGIPHDWIVRFEDGEWGVTRLLELARRLAAQR
jgi:poly(ADP-ribose) glycohydrolase ARH3